MNLTMLTANLNPESPYDSVCPNKTYMSKYDNTKVYWKL